MLRNILGPVFNLYLDQFLTYKVVNYFCFWGPKPLFVALSANMQNLKKHKNEKRHYLWTPLCELLLSKCPFFLHFSFLLFFQFPFCDVLIGFPKLKNTKKQNQSKPNTKLEQKEDKRCKAKTNEILWFKTKQDNKQNNKNQKNNFKEESKQNKKEKQERETEMKNRKEGSKKRTRERQRKRERETEKGESETKG